MILVFLGRLNCTFFAGARKFSDRAFDHLSQYDEMGEMGRDGTRGRGWEELKLHQYQTQMRTMVLEELPTFTPNMACLYMYVNIPAPWSIWETYVWCLILMNLSMFWTFNIFDTINVTG